MTYNTANSLLFNNASTSSKTNSCSSNTFSSPSSIKCFIRPGAPIAMLQFLHLMTSRSSGVPPMKYSIFKSAQVQRYENDVFSTLIETEYLHKPAIKHATFLNTSYTCLAISRVGASTKHCKFLDFVFKQVFSAVSRYTSVLPVPDLA